MLNALIDCPFSLYGLMILTFFPDLEMFPAIDAINHGSWELFCLFVDFDEYFVCDSFWVYALVTYQFLYHEVHFFVTNIFVCHMLVRETCSRVIFHFHF